MNDDDLVTIAKVEDLPELLVIKSMLDGAGVAYEVQGENAGFLLPPKSLPGFFGSSRLAVRVRVRACDVDLARSLLAASDDGGMAEDSSDEVF